MLQCMKILLVQVLQAAKELLYEKKASYEDLKLLCQTKQKVNHLIGEIKKIIEGMVY